MPFKLNAITGKLDYYESGSAGSLSVQESDGTPSITNVTTIKFPSNSVTDNGSGTVTIAIPVDVDEGSFLDALVAGPTDLDEGAF